MGEHIMDDYQSAFQKIASAVEGIEALRRTAFRQYSLLVEAVINNQITDQQEIQQIIDGLSDAYFASTVRLFRFSGLPVRLKRSEIIGEAAKLESQYFRCPGLQQPKPLQAGIHPI